MKKFLLSASFTTCLLAGNYASKACESWPNARLELGTRSGQFIAIHKPHEEAGLFVPFRCRDGVFFSDLRYYRFHNAKEATSFGLGWRQYICNDRIFGFNVYHDYRKSHGDFQRLGLGFELLNPCWDFRLNGYAPIDRTTRKRSDCRFKHIGRKFFARNKRFEFAYYGVDAELGTTLMRCGNWRLYGAAGPYGLFRYQRHMVWGGYGRLELDWNSFLSFQLRGSQDKRYNSRLQALVDLTIPLDVLFSCPREIFCTRQCNIEQPVRRNGIILTDTCCHWKWNW
jgi:hypothetical protein